MTPAKSIPPPPCTAHLPVDDHRGPVPWFAAWMNGGPEFRVADKLQTALRFGLCWVCGLECDPIGTFVIGSMCAVNRTTAEPPCHLDCARWSAQVCPFLTRPHARRRENNMPDGHTPPAGIMLARNPGVTLLWSTRDWSLREVGNGLLIALGDPTAVEWWCEGRTATRAEVVASINAGMPALRDMAVAEGPAAVLALQAQLASAIQLLPGLVV